MDYRRGLILLIMDVLLLAELTVAIWWAHFEPAEISWRFMQVFLPPAVLTVVGTRIALKRWAPKKKVSHEAAANQPWRPVNLFGALGQRPDSERREK
ncbi:MAG: hypothetical protein K9K66_17105 [Desulfarculaceae bacterium]|nr:hypothetical protein [Desulfarculaceae bacterium]MCF8074311.1 hypothetical protein [Desulfarculaceae bacterium]MCF8103379.1 hypothetical protein [Desulfarculaceae bacterium]MCF8117766.1 hypothetical protein [Desulfarculaceae bacterium]